MAEGTTDKTSTSASSLASALVEFQSMVPTISKNRTAKIKTNKGYDYEYQYADLGDIWDAIRPVLADASLAVTQSLIGGSDGWTGIKTTIWHASGESYSEVLDVPTTGKTAQEAGSQFTYFKRYALAATLGISTEEDDDGQAGNEKPEAPLRTAPAKESADDNTLARAKKRINEVLEEHGYYTAPAKIAFITGVLEHSTIDSVDEAELVAEEIENVMGVVI